MMFWCVQSWSSFSLDVFLSKRKLGISLSEAMPYILEILLSFTEIEPK